MMFWRLTSTFLALAAAVRPATQAAQAAQDDVTGPMRCRLKTEKGIGECLEMDDGAPKGTKALVDM